MKRISFFLYLLLVFLILLACGRLPLGRSTAVAQEPAPTQPATPEEPTTAASEPPPLTFAGVMLENIETGAWTQGQAIVTMLRYFNGELDVATTLGGKNVLPGEGTGVVQLADEYLAANPEAPEKTEIERLLGIVIPDGGKMMPFAEPEASTRLEGAKQVSLDRRTAADEVECSRLWQEGFEWSTLPRPICVTYRIVEAGGTQIRIFYRRGQQTQLNDALGWTVEAVTRAAQAYQPLSGRGLPAVDVTFTQLAHYDPQQRAYDPAASMIARSRDRARCNIGVFPGGVAMGESYFKQEMAHEMFHCVQFRNFDVGDSNLYITKKWWSEGSAEYFGNYVYPEVDKEYMHNGAWDANIADNDLFGMSYESYVFFQHLANTRGNEDIMRLLGAIPSGADSSRYQAALNAHFGTQAEDYWYAFAQQYLDRAIQDTNSRPIPLAPRDGQLVLVGANPLPASTSPYKFTWYRLRFPERFKYTNTVTTNGEGRSAARPFGMSGGWGALPATVSSACKNHDFTLLMTTTSPSHELHLSAALEPKKGCDPCLAGTWNLAPETLDPFLRSLIVASMEITSVAGEQTVVFTDEGRVEYSWHSIDFHAVANDSQHTAVDMQGFGSQGAEYEAVEGLLNHGPFEGVMSYHFWVGGEDLGESPENIAGLDLGLATDMQYQCSENELIYSPIVPERSISPLRYVRVPPETP